ncbi:MAG: hypothetical protein EUB_00543 [Eubacterium sp.]|uniref:DUF2142 domain-containing protein n=1 Tax=Eubacterium sp. TaxID=142586 RepID=UPI0030411F23
MELKNKRLIRSIIFFVSLAIICCSVSLFFYHFKLKELIKEPRESEVIGSIESNIGQIVEGEEIIQSFEISQDLKGITIYFGTYGQNANGQLSIVIKERKTNEIKLNMDLTLSELAGDTKKIIKFDHPIKIDEPTELELIISDLKDANGKPITVFSSSNDDYSEGNLTINGVTQDADIAISFLQGDSSYLLYYFMIFMFGLFLVGCLAYYFIVLKKIKKENVFLVFAVLLGGLYMFAMTPFSGFDEAAHFDTAYRYSNFILGKGLQTDNGGLLKRECDSIEGLSLSGPTRDTYQTVYEELSGKKENGNKSLIEESGAYVKEAPYVYTPQIVGITISRLLGFGRMQLFYFTRFCSLLVYAGIVWIAIRKTPIAKNIFLGVGLLPFVLFQESGFSYDGVIIALSYLFISYTLFLAFGKEEVKRKDIVICLLSGILLSPCKIVYILICLLIFIVPKKRIAPVLNYKVFLISFLLGIICAYSLTNLVSIMSKIDVNNSSISVETQRATYSISFIFKNPIEFLKIIGNTFIKRGGAYLLGIFGGIYTIQLPVLIDIIFMFVLALCSLKYRNENLRISLKEKSLFLVIIFGIVAALLSIALTWTGEGGNIIEGFQSRYFLPILPLIIIFGRNKSIVKIKNIDSSLYMTIVLLELVSLFYIFTYSLML